MALEGRMESAEWYRCFDAAMCNADLGKLDSCERLCNPGIDGCLQSKWSTNASFEYRLGDRLPSFVGSVDIYARGGSSSNTDRSLWTSEEGDLKVATTRLVVKIVEFLRNNISHFQNLPN